MTLDQPTLVSFEEARRKNHIIPPLGSNSFYTIGKGLINLQTEMNGKFDLFTDEGSINTGAGIFFIGQHQNDPDNLYDSLTVISDTSLFVNDRMIISNSQLDVYGNITLAKNSQVRLTGHSNMVLYHDAVLNIGQNSRLDIEGGSKLDIFGTLKIHINSIDMILTNPRIIIDSAAVIEVSGLDQLGPRVYSLKDYESELRNRIINVKTQGEHGTETGKIGYSWTGGSPNNHSQLVKLETLNGDSVLGDFKLSILGLPAMDIPNLQMISDLHIHEGTTLYISEEYHDQRYVRPELYLGIVIDNNSRPATCIVDGTIIVDGQFSMISIDRGASIHIKEGGLVKLVNGSIMRNTYNDTEPSLLIDGTLIVDYIEQISSFTRENIVFGPNGKVVILNPDSGEKRLLWSTPIGIHDSDLYRLFKDRLLQVEYHISNNCGIRIDQYYEFYAKDMRDWYGGMRIEKAIHEGLIVWHDGAYIELDHNIIPWAHVGGSLLDACQIFKSFGVDNAARLQDTVSRLQYAGCGDIVFRFIDGGRVSETILHLGRINMKTIVYNPLSTGYILTTDSDGDLFLRSNLPVRESIDLIDSSAKHLVINNKKSEFWLK